MNNKCYIKRFKPAQFLAQMSARILPVWIRLYVINEQLLTCFALRMGRNCPNKCCSNISLSSFNSSNFLRLAFRFCISSQFSFFAAWIWPSLWVVISTTWTLKFKTMSSKEGTHGKLQMLTENSGLYIDHLKTGLAQFPNGPIMS